MWSRKWKYNSESRKERALYQNLYLIETIPSTRELEKKFVVMGSTGNVYTVTICSEPSCTCPDYLQREQNCKHIFFILLKVMKIEDVDQDYFDDFELIEMFSNIPKITSNLIVDKTLRKLYKKQNGDNSEDEDDQEKEKKEDNSKVARKPVDDPCPICLEELKEKEEDIDYCKYGCGKSIHKKCFTMWSKVNKETCVFCRASWRKVEDDSLGSKSLAMSMRSNIFNPFLGNYVNLIDIQQSQSVTNNISNTGRVNYFLRNSEEVDIDDEEKDEEDQKINAEEEDENNIISDGKNTLSKSKSRDRQKKTRKKSKSLIVKPKSAYALYQAKQLEKFKKKHKGISTSSTNRKISEIKEKWKKLSDIQKQKYEVMASKDRERYKNEKNGDFNEKNKQNKKRKRVNEEDKKEINYDKRGKTKSRGRKKINCDEDK